VHGTLSSQQSDFIKQFGQALFSQKKEGDRIVHYAEFDYNTYGQLYTGINNTEQAIFKP